jgi:hypothetical protein
MVNNGVLGGMGSTRARIATAVAGVIAMLAVATVTGFFQFLVLGLGTCGGDGGSPYAANDSAQGRVCDVLDGGGLTAVAGLEIAALVAAAALLGLSAPSDNCSKADQAAYSTWLERGANGQPPADCDSY